MSSFTGRTLGAYEILEEIGQGGMANVYRAVQPSVGRTVAIKVLPSHFLQDRTFIERFTREAKIVANLQHPHILPIYDYGEDGGTPYIVMAYMSGGSLVDHIGRGMPLDQVSRIVDQIAEALDYAHGRGIVHRDFKPSNVLLDEQGNLYLADFGIAKVAEMTASLTGGSMIGTPAFIAPEMWKSNTISPLVDVYALGISLYQLLTGHLPYSGDSHYFLMTAHTTSPIPKIRDERPDLPRSIQKVINKAMAKEPMDRYPSAGELAADLRRLAPEPTPKSAKVEAPPKPAKTPTPKPTKKPTSKANNSPTVDVPLVVEPPTAQSRRLPTIPIAVGLSLLLIIALATAAIMLNGVLGGSGTPTQAAGLPRTPTSADAIAQAPTQAAAAVDAPTPTTTLTLTPAPTVIGGGTGEIAFAADAADGNGLDLYLMSIDGTNLSRLTEEPGSDYEQSWSPSGQRLVFDSERFGGRFNIFIINPDDKNVTRITSLDSPYSGQPTSPKWSPSGELIAYDAYLNVDSNKIAIMSIIGLNDHAISVPEVGDDFSPEWSPDSKYIVFESTRETTKRQIFVMGIDGSNVTRLTQNAADNIHPAWSPDGEQIAFASALGGSYGIYVMNSDGTNPTLLTEDGTYPAWSPDGTKLVFVSSRSGKPEIYIMDSDGSDITPITSTLSLTNYSSPDWRPAP